MRQLTVTLAVLGVLTLFSMRLNGQTSSDNYISAKDGTRLFVKKSGNGAICIFIHGGPGAWSKSFEDLKGSNLEQHLSMVYYDQRGCGRSDKSANGNYSLQTMVDDIDLIRQHFKADKVYLLAHSFGGILAANYALKYPDHVKGLILTNSTLNLRYSLENQIGYMGKLLNSDFRPKDRSNKSLMAAFMKAKRLLTEKHLDYKMLSDNKRSVDQVDQIDHENPSDFDFAKHVFQVEDYWKDYSASSRKIKVPVLVITGTKDHAIGEDHYKSFQFLNQQIAKIQGGHLLYYENNSAFLKAVFGFIE